MFLTLEKLYFNTGLGTEEGEVRCGRDEGQVS